MTSTSLTPLTAGDLEAALAVPLSFAEAMRLAEQLQEQVGREALLSGVELWTDDLAAAWILAAPDARHPPEIVLAPGTALHDACTRLGTSDVWALAVTLPDGAARRWTCTVDGNRRGEGQLEVYRTPPESREQTGVPRGVLNPQPAWRSTIFPGTVRDWHLYVPAQYDATQPACVMVFQDGSGYLDFVPRVFDHLIAEGAMPVTLGIFLDPGVFADTTVSNRSFEYDTLSDQYSRLVLEEILPEVAAHYRLREDPDAGGIGGISSGGICAFTVAWQRPDRFRKVLSWVGSFTNIASGSSLREGGHNYPALIRKAPKKPIRVYLQGGAQDLDNAHGNWPLANQEMAKALAFAGYDYQFVFGEGFHSPLHGRATLPDALRWLWRNERT